jgi:hypothetical protein
MGDRKRCFGIGDESTHNLGHGRDLPDISSGLTRSEHCLEGPARLVLWRYLSSQAISMRLLKVPAGQLGHADTRMVEKHYGHLLTSYVAETVRVRPRRFIYPVTADDVRTRPSLQIAQMRRTATC